MSQARIDGALNDFQRAMELHSECVSSTNLWAFIIAAELFVKAMAEAGGPGHLYRTAEMFAEWMIEESGLDKCELVHPPDPEDRTLKTMFHVPVPLLPLELTEGFPLQHFQADNRCPTDNPVGYYLLYLCGISRDVEESNPDFGSKLTDCLAKDPPRLLEMIRQAANDLYWLARRQVSEQPMSSTPEAADPPTEVTDHVGEKRTGEQPKDAAAAGQRGTYHGPDEEPPPSDWYCAEHLTGTKTDLSMAFPTRARTRDPRRLDKAVEGGRIWARGTGHTYDIFFKSKAAFEAAKKRYELWRTSQNTPKPAAPDTN
jgi:hypothetical protein